MNVDSKGSGESAHVQGLHEPSFLDTAMSTTTQSNVLAHLIYSLLLAIIYLACFEISKGMQLHKYDHVPMWHAKFQI